MPCKCNAYIKRTNRPNLGKRCYGLPKTVRQLCRHFGNSSHAILLTYNRHMTCGISCIGYLNCKVSRRYFAKLERSSRWFIKFTTNTWVLVIYPGLYNRRLERGLIMATVMHFPRPKKKQRIKRNADGFKYFNQLQIKLIRRTARDAAILAESKGLVTADDSVKNVLTGIFEQPIQ